jgi:hypothetical protein
MLIKNSRVVKLLIILDPKMNKNSQTKKSRVGRSAFIFYFIYFFIIGKTGNSRSRFRNPIPVVHFLNFR